MGGAVVHQFFELISSDVEVAHPVAEASGVAARTGEALSLLREVTAELQVLGGNEVGAAAVDYLRMFALVALGWMWTRMSVAAASSDNPPLRAKHDVATYFSERVLPQVQGLAIAIRAGATPMMKLPSHAF
jgi:hypothetical protein